MSADAPAVLIGAPTSGKERDAVCALFREYAESLGFSLGFQGFEQEMGRFLAAVRRGGGSRVRAWSRELSEPGALVEYEIGAERPGRGWLDYIQGVTVALARSGHPVEGFDLWLASDVPLGSGLSSSAALEVSLLRALSELFALDLDDVRLAQLGRAVETEFVGVPIGIMELS